MSDKELQEVIRKTVEECKKNNGNGKWLVRGIWTLVVALAVTVGTSIYNYGMQEQRVRELEDNKIERTEWEAMDKDVFDLKNMVWKGKDTRYATRGQSIAPNL